ncbi:cupin domain-containing protein [Streptomyces sp. NPDC001978]|uniref:cupin domain-containing protein n=1 Tax=Streptomyces sp. NPDC001978 TaxID=3364627 RepID=UPI0036AE1BAB
MSDVRLVQTGLDAQGRSTVVSDERVASVAMPTGRRVHPLWSRDEPLGGGASAEGISGPFPPPGGIRYWLFTVPAGERDPASFGLHRTETVDLGFVVSGVLTLALEDGTSTDLHVGDAFIQRGTTHAWFNRGSQDAVAVLTVLGGS